MLTYSICVCSCAVAVLHVYTFVYSSSTSSRNISSARKELKFSNPEKKRNLESPTENVMEDDLSAHYQTAQVVTMWWKTQ